MKEFIEAFQTVVFVTSLIGYSICYANKYEMLHHQDISGQSHLQHHVSASQAKVNSK